MRIFLCAVILIIVSCQADVPGIPKPRTYPRIIFPKKQYRLFDETYCPLRFMIPDYTVVRKDEHFFDEKPADPCWFDLINTQFNSSLYCSYYPISSRTRFDSLVADAFKMVDKHRIKANFIEEIPIHRDHSLSGVFFELNGPVASPYQFYLTDSTRHFLRAALYFRNTPNPDSMSIIHTFFKEDLLRMIQTFEWGDRN